MLLHQYIILLNISQSRKPPCTHDSPSLPQYEKHWSHSPTQTRTWERIWYSKHPTRSTASVRLVSQRLSHICFVCLITSLERPLPIFIPLNCFNTGIRFMTTQHYALKNPIWTKNRMMLT